MATILYICNHKNKCSKSDNCVNNGGSCSHTTSIKFAKNFERKNDADDFNDQAVYVETEKDE